MRMRLRMLKHGIGKGRHVMKQLHIFLGVLQYYATSATERAGYVLYRALVMRLYLFLQTSGSSHEGIEVTLDPSELDLDAAAMSAR